jgi:hypothetical protein
MAQPAKHNKGWSKQEITVLKESYRKGVLHREIAKQLKRTLNAVESKATELGLKSRRKKAAK